MFQAFPEINSIYIISNTTGVYLYGAIQTTDPRPGKLTKNHGSQPKGLSCVPYRHAIMVPELGRQQPVTVYKHRICTGSILANYGVSTGLQFTVKAGL